MSAGAASDSGLIWELIVDWGPTNSPTIIWFSHASTVGWDWEYWDWEREFWELSENWELTKKKDLRIDHELQRIVPSSGSVTHKPLDWPNCERETIFFIFRIRKQFFWQGCFSSPYYWQTEIYGSFVTNLELSQSWDEVSLSRVFN